MIASTATAVPQHVISRELVEAQIGRVFSLSGRRLEAVLEIVANSRIERRYSIFPVEYLIEPRPLEQISREYRDHSLCLGRRAAQQALDRAGIAPQEVDMILTVSCTGFMIPSLDAYLAPEMGLRPNVRRLPVTELGCAAGAAGLAMARDYVRAHPGATVLLVAVELPTLTFQRRRSVAGQPGLDDSVWRRRGRGGGHGPEAAAARASWIARAFCFRIR